MTKKSLKSWKTLASESKGRRKTKLTPEQVEKLNKIVVETDGGEESKNVASKSYQYEHSFSGFLRAIISHMHVLLKPLTKYPKIGYF